MIVFKEILEYLDNEQTIDVTCGVDENNSIKTPKTVFYGKAIDAYANRKSLEGFWVRKVLDINAYVDTLKGESVPVVMITLRSYD